MAQLKDLIVAGSSRLLGEVTLQSLRLPSSSNSASLGLGSSGQVLKSNGSSVYWANDNNTTYNFSASNPTLNWGTTSTIGTAGSATYKVTMPAAPSVYSTTAPAHSAGKLWYNPNLGYLQVSTGSAWVKAVNLKLDNQLDAPTISLNGYVISITPVSSATKYHIFVDGVYKYSSTTTSFICFIGGTYTVVASGEGYIDSVFSNALTISEASSASVVKGGLLNIDLNGDGTTEQYRVVSIDGTNAQIVAMTDATTMTFGSSQVYANSSLDTYLNTTWYNTLSDTAKAAIVDKTFRQASWYYGSSGSPVYNGYYGNTKPGTSSYSVSLANASFGEEITRHVYALSIQDVIDYVTDTNVTDGQLQNYNIWKMFWNDEVSHSGYLWLRCANAGYSDRVFYVSGSIGYVNGSYGCTDSDEVRPALTLDLSKINFTVSGE